MSKYYIAHSSGPWKKHKYAAKKGSGNDAIYIYNQPKGNGRDVVGVAGLRPKSSKELKTASEKVSKRLESWVGYKVSVGKRLKKILEGGSAGSIPRAKKAKKAKKAKRKLPKVYVQNGYAVRM